MEHRQLFNTGVLLKNSLDANGKLIKMPHDVWKGGVKHIEFWLEKEPPANSRRDWLQDAPLTNLNERQIAIRIVGGGMLSEYAVFTVFKKDDNEPVKKHCDQCDWTIASGMFIHEHGCPNIHSTWDEEAGRWFRYRRCLICEEEFPEDNEHNCLDEAE